MGRYWSFSEPLEVRRFLSAAPLLAQTAGVNLPASAVLETATAPQPSNGGVSLTESANHRFTAMLGQFTFKAIDQALTAIVNWGDGEFSSGNVVISYATGINHIHGTHAYATPGTYKITVQVFARPFGSPIQPTDPVVQFVSVILVTQRPR